MIETLKIVGLGIGLLVAILGVVGGLLSLPDKIKHFKRMRRPRGDRGTNYFIMSREDTSDYSIVEYLVSDDLLHFLGAFGNLKGRAITLRIESVGEFYRVRMQFKPGALDNVKIVKKSQN